MRRSGTRRSRTRTHGIAIGFGFGVVRLDGVIPGPTPLFQEVVFQTVLKRLRFGLYGGLGSGVGGSFGEDRGGVGGTPTDLASAAAGPYASLVNGVNVPVLAAVRPAVLGCRRERSRLERTVRARDTSSRCFFRQSPSATRSFLPSRGEPSSLRQLLGGPGFPAIV